MHKWETCINLFHCLQLYPFSFRMFAFLLQRKILAKKNEDAIKNDVVWLKDQIHRAQFLHNAISLTKTNIRIVGEQWKAPKMHCSKSPLTQHNEQQKLNKIWQQKCVRVSIFTWRHRDLWEIPSVLSDFCRIFNLIEKFSWHWQHYPSIKFIKSISLENSLRSLKTKKNWISFMNKNK